MDRRRFLQGAASVAAGVVLVGCDARTATDEAETGDTSATPQEPPRRSRPGVAWDGVATFDAEAFPFGVQVGDPTQGSAVFWTATRPDASVTVHIAWWDEGAQAWGAATEVTAVADAAGYVHALVEDLASDAAFAFQFVDATGAGSSIGHARTAPDVGAQGVVSLGFTSCLAQRHEVFPSLQATQVEGPLDAFLFLGDTGYFDDLVGIDAYRALWQRQLVAPGLQDVLRALILSLLSVLLGRRRQPQAWLYEPAWIEEYALPFPQAESARPIRIRSIHDGTHLVCEHPILYVIGPGPGKGMRPIARAISTAGGLRFADVTDDLMVASKPGLFVAGEMLDWEAPTGGYLLQACFATGRAAGAAAAGFVG